MLRAWIIFSKQMRELAGKPGLSISPMKRKHIGQLLRDCLPEKSDWSPSQIREDRQQVMDILRPHFSGTVDIVPLVVEEILEHHSPLGQPGLRYARLLRNNIWVKKTLRLEYERIVKLLEHELTMNV